jgi:hypothetical protein
MLLVLAWNNTNGMPGTRLIMAEMDTLIPLRANEHEHGYTDIWRAGEFGRTGVRGLHTWRKGFLYFILSNASLGRVEGLEQ